MYVAESLTKLYAFCVYLYLIFKQFPWQPYEFDQGNHGNLMNGIWLPMATFQDDNPICLMLPEYPTTC